MKTLKIVTLALIGLLASCNADKAKNRDQNENSNPVVTEVAAEKAPLKQIKKGLPTIGLIMYDQVLMTEVTAPIDVFTKPSEEGKQLFNVITIAETMDPVESEEGLTMLPDYTFDNCPELDIIFVPSAYDMSTTVKNDNIVNFIKQQNTHTDYTVSNCAGAHLIGESGIADGMKIVTYIGGGEELQENYPNLKVQDDASVSYVEDGKFISSNGNLASYISSLELLEKLTDKKHRKRVESNLYLDRLQNWGK